MTVKELVTKFIERNHFVISLHNHRKINQFDFEQTFFTAGDYKAIEGTAMEYAEKITIVDEIDEVPAEITKMEVTEFMTSEDLVLIIFVDI